MFMLYKSIPTFRPPEKEEIDPMPSQTSSAVVQVYVLVQGARGYFVVQLSAEHSHQLKVDLYLSKAERCCLMVSYKM